MEELATYEGAVHSVIFQNAENGYTVLRLLVEGGEVITVVGCIPCVAPGEQLAVSGVWEQHPQHGGQLRAVELERALPEDEEEIFSYLASGICRGVGPATARRIVDRFGKAALDILEREPERLNLIKGITAKKAQEIAESFRRQMGLRRLMEFLARYQLPPVLAMQLRQRYGDGALDQVRENPYLLSGDACGVAFSVTDEIAMSLGMSAESKERLEAAVTFELSHNEGNGHVFLPRDKLIAATCQLLQDGDPERLEAALDALVERGTVVREQVAGVDACYLRRLWEAETSACLRLNGLLAATVDTSRQADRTLAEIETEAGITYAPQQRQAVRLAAERGGADPHRRPRHRQDHHCTGDCGPIAEDGAGDRAGGAHRPGGQADERADGYGGPDHPPPAGHELDGGNGKFPEDGEGAAGGGRGDCGRDEYGGPDTLCRYG